MDSIRDQKVFKELEFQIWRIWEERRKKWRDTVYIIGDDKVLKIIRNSLQDLLNTFEKYGKGTRKYICNPPKDFDHVSYGQQYNVRIQWLNSLIVRLSPEAEENEMHILEDLMVILNVDPNTLKLFIEKIESQLTSIQRYSHGSELVCGLRFSPDWLGLE